MGFCTRKIGQVWNWLLSIATPGKLRPSTWRKTPASVRIPRLIFILCVLFLSVYGAVMVYSSSIIYAYTDPKIGDMQHYFNKHIMFLALGFIAAFIVVALPVNFWRNEYVLSILWVIFLLFLVLVAVKGSEAGGAKRWVYIGFSFQPSELGKILIVLITAALVLDSDKDVRFWFFNWRAQPRSLFTVLLGVFLIAIPLFFILVLQSDMGTAILILVGMIAVLVFGNVNWKFIVALIAVLAAFGIVAVISSDYRMTRWETYVDSFLKVNVEVNDANRQSRHALFALGSGGLWGNGLGMSHEKYGYLAEGYTDFIFAILGDELGLIRGTIPVILLYALLLYSGIAIARNARNPFGTMVAAGSTCVLVFQALLNIAMVSGLIPVVGKTLPFISSGGSSLICCYIMAGFVLSVSFDSVLKDGSPLLRRRRMRVHQGGAGRPSSSRGNSGRSRVVDDRRNR